MLKNSEKIGNIRETALGVIFYNSASIIGPIIIFGVIGYFLDKAFGSRHLFLLSGIFVAFVVTNILIFRKVFKIMAELNGFKESGKDDYGENKKIN